MGRKTKNDEKLFYKIRRKGTTDQFSSGGRRAHWSKQGKIWSNIGHVKNHISQKLPWMADYTEAEIVSFTLVEKDTTDVKSLLDEIRLLQEKKAEKRAELERLRREQHERYELRVLMAKYPDE